MDRRDFFKKSFFFFCLSSLPFGLKGWAAGLGDESGKDARNKKKKLIVLFQRGAVDGLSVVVPYAESFYYDARPTIAIPSGGGKNSIIDLNGRFGLHPSLEAVMPLWKNKTLGFIHASGSPDSSRSHFDAQGFMESGTPGILGTPDGWMNRLLQLLPETSSSTQAIAMGSVLPRIFQGEKKVSNLALGRNPTRQLPVDRPRVESIFDQLYDGNDSLSQAYQEGQKARKQFLFDMEEEAQQADGGAPSPIGFGKQTQALGRLLRQDPGIQLVFLDLGGWDTHVNQGSTQGQLANHLKQLGDGLASLTAGLGPALDETVILVMSEFGRTVHENGNGGTDHGHGNAMWVLGGPVKGGEIYGDWPGLSINNLYEGRDLPVTTDFRHAVSSILTGHFGLDPSQMKNVFPNMPDWKIRLNLVSP